MKPDQIPFHLLRQVVTSDSLMTRWMSRDDFEWTENFIRNTIIIVKFHSFLLKMVLVDNLLASFLDDHYYQFYYW